MLSCNRLRTKTYANLHAFQQILHEKKMYEMIGQHIFNASIIHQSEEIKGSDLKKYYAASFEFAMHSSGAALIL